MGWRSECLRAGVAKETLGEAAGKCILKSGQEGEEQETGGVGAGTQRRAAFCPRSCVLPDTPL